MTVQPSPVSRSTGRHDTDPWPRFQDDVAHALDQAQQALVSPDARSLDGVVWAAAHLAAFERAVLPVVRRTVGDGPTAVEEVRRHATVLENALRMFERWHTGDVLAAQVDAARLRRRLLELLMEHGRVERRLLSRLGDRLNPTEQEALAAAYRRALEHAPTRPHPHVPHGGALGALAFRVDAFRDRLMDVMDSRHVPTPRVPREAVRPGRWGLWLLGRSRPDDGIEAKTTALNSTESPFVD